VLVTHQRQFLPKCDRITVLRDGCLLACGSWQELLPMRLPELTGGAVTMCVDAAEEEDEQQDVHVGQGADQQPTAAAVGHKLLQQAGSILRESSYMWVQSPSQMV
jgi:ABC-type multidrug transport system ATPase subunit